ncbi:MAG: restriction endonuclease subunit S [Gammaproteobacteria bacterium]|nr:restriction endonuclease subunit S [Gammaproteobacteria bacterium]
MDIVVRPTDLQNDMHSLRVGISRERERGIITSAYICLAPSQRLTPEYCHRLLHSYDLAKVFYGLGSGLRQNLDWTDFKRLPCLVPPLVEQAAITRFLNHADRIISRYIAAKEKLIALLDEYKQALVHQAVTGQIDVRTGRPYPAYRDSGVEGFGAIPQNWAVMPLKRVLSRLVDCEHKTAPAVPNSPYHVVRTSGVRNGKLNWAGTYCTDVDSFERWTRRTVPRPNDVIFTREAPAGEACLVPSGRRVCLGQRTVLMRTDQDRYDPSFLVHMIYEGPPKPSVNIASQGATVGHFNVDDIGSLPVFVPPLDEQVAVVAFLSRLISRIGNARSLLEQATLRLREYRTRLIADVVTGKLDVREAAAALPDLESDADGVEFKAELDGTAPIA